MRLQLDEIYERRKGYCTYMNITDGLKDLDMNEYGLSSCPKFLKWVTQCLRYLQQKYCAIESSLLLPFPPPSTARPSTPCKPHRFAVHRLRCSLTSSSLAGFLPAATIRSQEVDDTVHQPRLRAAGRDVFEPRSSTGPAIILLVSLRLAAH